MCLPPSLPLSPPPHPLFPFPIPSHDMTQHGALKGHHGRARGGAFDGRHNRVRSRRSGRRGGGRVASGRDGRSVGLHGWVCVGVWVCGCVGVWAAATFEEHVYMYASLQPPPSLPTPPPGDMEGSASQSAATQRTGPGAATLALHTINTGGGGGGKGGGGGLLATLGFADFSEGGLVESPRWVAKKTRVIDDVWCLFFQGGGWWRRRVMGRAAASHSYVYTNQQHIHRHATTGSMRTPA